MEINGKLPTFISIFFCLEENLRLESIKLFPTFMNKKWEFPRGKTLSITLYYIRINSQAKVLMLVVTPHSKAAILDRRLLS